MAYLGGHGATAPLWPTHENFLQATLYEKGAFLPLSSKNLANLRLPLNVQKQKVFQLSSRPPDPRPGALPLHMLCALAMTPLCQILNTPLETRCILVQYLITGYPPTACHANHGNAQIYAFIQDMYKSKLLSYPDKCRASGITPLVWPTPIFLIYSHTSYICNIQQ